MKPWEETDVWNNESQYLMWMRGHFRKMWSHYPPKIAFKNERCITVDTAFKEAHNLSKSCKFAGQCEFCNSWFPKSKLEVDHKIECGELTLENKSEWIDRLLCKKEDMRLACKPCHKIHTYAERMGLTFEEAAFEKRVIEFSKKPVGMQKKLLEKAGLPCNNASVRRESYKTYLTTIDPLQTEV